MTFLNWSKNRNVVFLTLLLSSINIWAIMHYWLVIDFNERMVAIFSNHCTPILLMAGPSLYFYVRGVIKDDFIWKKSDLFHLIPAATQLALILPYTFGYTFEEKINIMTDIHNNPSDYLETNFNPVFNALQTGAIRISSFTFYLIFSSYLLIEYLLKSTKSMLINVQRHIALRWLIYLHTSLFLILGLYIYLIHRSNADYRFALSSQSYTLQNSLSFLISINNLSLLLIPEIFLGLIIPRKPRSSVEQIVDFEDQGVHKPLHDIEYLIEISSRIDEVMMRDKPFLDKEFKIIQLANSLEIPQHHLSSCLRNIKETTFTDLKNSYRIDAFKEKIKSGALKNLTVDGLREECGFRSKSSFYAAFQKKEGMTPLEYLSKK